MRPKKNGFTTLELVSGVSVLSLISLVLVQSLLTTRTVWESSYTHAWLHTEATRAANMMVKYIREGDPSSPIGITIDNDGKHITFAIPKEYNGTTVTEWRQVEFSFDDQTGELSKTIDGGPQTEVIGRLISNCQFQQVSDRIHIALTTQTQTAGNRALSISLASQVTMRN
ncbi:MAG: hypothetical protein COV74_10595 [Candidatus Omnitrophica bacterium CG11_big_fil_rev_8_21_14_0_20_45_26]|uniref:Uncharacterized protein n=1 Tax=Candidatus Abzuiibacterium crystallinum TaxID=1974748 RepID=A0A2H0LKU6_9BACT|nr:MAG: hypothetical protein COV74_10595 [Candidatus Omnitrophica bacterium CG11_big_fil_rev_8_21_14_0_20_45_26]PIW63885.1 MAG: hypothetical protein COW12_08215 [Candidatus Omnitrophica bacterium CG12_big_fil_rev_8_21_14_0_65_45_16]